MNVYDPAVVGKHRENATIGPQMKARVEVAKMREEFIESDEESEEEVGIPNLRDVAIFGRGEPQTGTRFVGNGTVS